ncbi:hypothetical protein J1N35_040859 [Gossypium stocksii]|uniref:Reverse transcriptase zinc-binding domain-containing protein n=1 Tax=Gossypium stocksii TaxID=47602 RepID=A0A9D3ZIP1_9ROSI|nr:hypothetical protein J1N35_040859 [Gossypium stocksii]
MGDQICKMLIFVNGPNDRRVWFHNPYGFYTSKSAYSWLLLKQVGFVPHKLFWKTIWKLKTLPKICVFSWRVGHELLPTNVKILSIHQAFKECLRCGAKVETLIHTLQDCPTTRAILVLSGLDNKLLVRDYSCWIDWIKDVMRVFYMKAVANFIMMLWNSWYNRNNYVFRGKEDEVRVIWDRAKTLCQDFRIHNLVNKPVLPITPACKT